VSEAGTRRMGEEGHRVCRQGGCSLAPRLLAVPGVCLSTVKLSDCPILFCKSVKGFQECGFDVKGCGTKSALFEDFFEVLFMRAGDLSARPCPFLVRRRIDHARTGRPSLIWGLWVVVCAT
jgi:hypothetical protein